MLGNHYFDFIMASNRSMIRSKSLVSCITYPLAEFQVNETPVHHRSLTTSMVPSAQTQHVWQQFLKNKQEWKEQVLDRKKNIEKMFLRHSSEFSIKKLSLNRTLKGSEMLNRTYSTYP